MAKLLNRLKARAADTLKKPGMHADGGGLYLFIGKPTDDGPGAKSWLFLFRWSGKRREMGLGSVKTVTLAEARGAALKARKHINDGKNPILERRRERGAAPTFGALADDLIKEMAPTWRGSRTEASWKRSLEVLAKPLRELSVDQIETADITKLLRPMWSTRPSVVPQVRARIERVLDAAKAQEWRAGDNPARWRGHLALLLAPNSGTKAHHPAMPFVDVPAYLVALGERKAVTAACLEFIILTAVRSGEARGAQWREFDEGAALWTIPASRMKSGLEHRVPLHTAALAVLVEMARGSNKDPGGFVFGGYKGALGHASIRMMIQRQGWPGHFTVHGFRSSFRDWVGEATEFPTEIAEAALAHRVGTATERAYRRGDALERRRKMMDAWGDYCVAKRLEAASVYGDH